MSKQCIVLETNSVANPGVINVRYLLWLTTASPVVNNSRTSAYSLASAGEIAAIQAGTTIEEQYTVQFPSTMPISEMKVYLNRHITSRQNYWNSVPGPASFFQVFFDSVSGWSA